MKKEQEAGKVIDAPLAGATSGHLVIQGGVRQLWLSGAELPGRLFRATFQGEVPRVVADGGRVTVDTGRMRLGKHPTKAVSLELCDAIEWDIDIQGGLRGGRLKLSALGLRNVSLSGGVQDVEIELPRPTRAVGISVVGGFSNSRILRPKDSALLLNADGGISDLRLDGQRVAEDTTCQLASREVEDSPDQFRLTVTGGASHVEITSLSQAAA